MGVKIMKANAIVYFRMWANIFNFNGTTKRKDFIIDFIIHIAVCVSLAFIIISLEKVMGIFLIPIVLFVYNACFLPFLSLATRRIRDTGNPPLLSLMSLMTITIIPVVILCFFKSKEEIEPERFKRKNRLRLGVLFGVTLVIVSSPMVYIVSVLSYDIFLLKDGKTTYLNTNIEDYSKEVETIKNAKYMMPKLEELQGYSNVEMAAMEKIYSTFLGYYSNTISLYVTYDENFVQEKEKVTTKYDYLEDAIYNGEEYESLAPCFSYNGYDYKVVLDENYMYFGPAKSFMVVGVNEAKKQIAYHYFYDFDIDYIADGNQDLTKESQSFMESNFYYFKD